MNIYKHFTGDAEGNYVSFSDMREKGVEIPDDIDEELHKKECCVICKVGNMLGNECKVYTETIYDNGLVDYVIVVTVPDPTDEDLIENMLRKRFRVDPHGDRIISMGVDDNCDRGFCGVEL